MSNILPIHKDHFKKILYLVAFICSSLLFVGGPDYYSARSFQHVWNLGHIFVFAIWSYILFSTRKNLLGEDFLRQIVRVSFCTLFIGILIEVTQVWVNRSFEIRDLWRNIVGILFTLVFFSPSRKSFSKLSLRVFQTFVCLLVIVESLPLGRALMDEAASRKQFPTLSNFETPFELDRWSVHFIRNDKKKWKGTSEISISHKIVGHGKGSLKVVLGTDRYSGIGLRGFPGDWRNFRYLRLSIFNPSSEQFKIIGRVHDDLHIENGQPYSDRFNNTYILSNGWNEITISIEEILHAPEERRMNMSQISGVGIFTVDLSEKKVIYIDDVYLLKEWP